MLRLYVANLELQRGAPPPAASGWAFSQLHNTGDASLQHCGTAPATPPAAAWCTAARKPIKSHQLRQRWRLYKSRGGKSCCHSAMCWRPHHPTSKHPGHTRSNATVSPSAVTLLVLHFLTGTKHTHPQKLQWCAVQRARATPASPRRQLASLCVGLFPAPQPPFEPPNPHFPTSLTSSPAPAKTTPGFVANLR